MDTIISPYETNTSNSLAEREEITALGYPQYFFRIKADTHEGYCSQSMLQGRAPCSRDTLREQSSSVCTNDFIGILYPREQNLPPAKCSTIFNRLSIREQAPGAN